METIGQRIEQVRLKKGLTKTDIWKAAGLSSGVYKQWLDGGKLSADSLLKVSAILGVDPQWLETGVKRLRPVPASMFAREPVATYKVNDIDSRQIVSDDINIDQFDTGGAMGSGLILRDQPGVIHGWRVTTEWINKNVKSHSGVKNLCIVTGFGDSMRGMFNPGDPLLVDIGVKTVEFDAVYFFRVGNEGFIKRLQRIPGDGIRVISKNKDYETWTISEAMDFEVFGRVLKVWCSEDF